VASSRLTFASAARKQNCRKLVVTHRNGDTENDLSRKQQFSFQTHARRLLA